VGLAKSLEMLRHHTDRDLTALGMEGLIPYLDMVRGTTTMTEELRANLIQLELASAFDPLRAYDIDKLNEYSDNLDEIPKGYQMMLTEIAKHTKDIDMDNPEITDLLTLDQLKLMDVASRYQESLVLRNGIKKAADLKTKEEEDAILKAKADAEMAYNSFELKNRTAKNQKINDIAAEALTNGEYANATALKQTETSLTAAYKLKVYYGVLGGANESEMARVELDIARLTTKRKKQRQEINAANSREYDEAEIKAKFELEDKIREITREGIANGDDVDDIKARKLEAKKAYYLKIKGLARQAESTAISTTKALNDLELQIFALETKVGKKTSKSYNLAKLAAEEQLAEKKATLAMQEATGNKTSRDVKREILELELAHYELLASRGDSNPAERTSNSRKLSNVKISLAKIEHQDYVDKETEKRRLQLETADLVADALKASANSTFDNWNKRNEEQKTALQDRLDSGAISQSRYDEQLEALEKKAFNKRKKNEQKLATISFMQELGNIAVAAAANPANAITFGGAGISQYALMAGLALGRYTLAMSTISSQKFANGGMVHGNSHAQGGEKFAVGGRVVELEGGEAVINKRSASLFRNQLSAINVAGGGVGFAGSGSSGGGSGSGVDYDLLAKVIGRNTNVVLPVESLNQVQNRVKTIEDGSRF